MSNRSTFIEQAEAIILENLASEQFGVSELADAMHMSRSNLLRKIKKRTQLSASQFIRKVRLQEAMALLKETSSTVSEISYQVGFGSTSYFIKCFREQYGYPPGEVGKAAIEEKTEQVKPNYLKIYRWPIIAGTSIILLIIAFLPFRKKDAVQELEVEKSIAVLPFKNESADSTNLYFVNGLMESALNNLQKIEDLRVISRTSVEKYRKTDKGIPEIAEELHVNYLVEGSGQRVGNQVLLNVQLIEASSDTPIWVEQYSQEVTDVFALQNDVAKKIAKAIKAVVTPAELEQIEKRPTENLVAYDYYLQALDLLYSQTTEGLEKAIPLFQKAVEQDPEFALAYANLAISYYYLDIHRKQKRYTDLINNYSDKALLYDSKNDVSLISRALYYMHTEEYRLALPHLEKALEYNPNSADVVQVLSILYYRYIPDTAEYLKYALLGIQLDIAANDSIAKGYIYLTLSNALAQTGFVNEAFEYINKSLDYDSANAFAPYLKAYIQYAKNGDIEQTKNSLIKELEKDTTRLDILQEVAKMHYFQEDYDGAFKYYKKFVETRKDRSLNIYPEEDGKIALVYEKMGLKEQAADFFKRYAEYCERDESIYKSASMALKYAYEGKVDQGIEQLNHFAVQDHFQYWILLFIEMDPLIKPLKKHPEYSVTIQKIKDRFWENQAKLKTSLEEEGLL
ncbi:helix-turn-helix domain-containing protein [Pricia sp. S334]|uniref:Helix-turn-helix domain-containing protein n=1 Tax=Pricia mediterranea TaxID=3076079 RepID=A0ABU3L743_9FLAO|nr:helix-turn-helix domain-containing protein [Pricia sp. S334]MDT7829559.1 helix-turn-helix domain-containing protein [Pricia sp. S334]